MRGPPSSRDISSQYRAQIKKNFYDSLERERSIKNAQAYRFENHSYKIFLNRANNWALEQYSQFPDVCYNQNLVENLKINCPDLCGMARNPEEQFELT